MRPVTIVIAALAAFSLNGCGPQIECTNNVDGISALATLNASDSPPAKLSDAVLSLLTSCNPSPDQKITITSTVSNIASNAPADIQESTYRQLSRIPESAEYRIAFINKSTLVSGSANAVIKPLKAVDFDSVGSSISPKTLSIQARSTLTELGMTELTEDKPHPDLREAKSTQGTIILARLAHNDGFSESISVAFINKDSGRPLQVQIEPYQFVSPPNKNSFNEYFFDCSSRSGDSCGIRDSKYIIIESTGELRYLISRSKTARDVGSCQWERSVYHVNRDSIVGLPQFLEKTTATCTDQPSIDSHGNPFDGHQEAEILLALSTSQSSANLLELIDFKRKDAADDRLRAALLAQGNRWKPSFLRLNERSKHLQQVSALGSVSQRIERLSSYASALLMDITNIKWAFRDAAIDDIYRGDLDKTEQEARRIQAEIGLIRVPDSPPARPPLPFKHERLTIGLARELTEADAVLRVPQFPYVYLASSIFKSEVIIVYSERNLAEGPRVLALDLVKAESAGEYRIGAGAFSQKIWSYSIPTESQKIELEKYKKDIANFNETSRSIEETKTWATERINAIAADLINLENSFSAAQQFNAVKSINQH